MRRKCPEQAVPDSKLQMSEAISETVASTDWKRFAFARGRKRVCFSSAPSFSQCCYIPLRCVLLRFQHCKVPLRKGEILKEPRRATSRHIPNCFSLTDYLFCRQAHLKKFSLETTSGVIDPLYLYRVEFSRVRFGCSCSCSKQRFLLCRKCSVWLTYEQREFVMKGR